MLCEQDPQVLGSCRGHHLPPLQVPQSKCQPPGGFRCSGITRQGQPGVSEGGVRTWFLPPRLSLPRSLLSRPRNPPGGRKCPLISPGSFILLGLALFTWLKQMSHHRKLSGCQDRGSPTLLYPASSFLPLCLPFGLSLTFLLPPSSVPLSSLLLVLDVAPEERAGADGRENCGLGTGFGEDEGLKPGPDRSEDRAVGSAWGRPSHAGLGSTGADCAGEPSWGQAVGP